jgi:exopolysaccharide biosynthesis polyprenyl glycosylphosphotransferase
MLRDRAETVGALFYLVDLCVLVVASVAAHAVRTALDPMFPEITDYAPLFGFMIAIWSMLMYRFGLYDTPRGGSVQDDFVGLIKVSVAGFFLAGALIFGLKLYFVSRLLVGIFSIVAFVLLSCERVIMRPLIARTSASERSVLVVGRGTQVQEIRGILQDEEHWGVRLVEPHVNPVMSADADDTAAAVSTLLTTTVVDEVIFAVSPSELAHIEPSLLVCERLGVKAHVSVAMGNLQLAKAVTNELRGIPLLTFTTTPLDERHLLAKRVLDVAASTALLTLLAPLMAMIALAVKLTSRGPVMFKQVRAGANGRPFVMYKFRSMCEEAESLQAQLAGANEMSGPVFKMRNDPRLTPLGRFLRRTSFDELPQLWNVLKGEMSLVGPRPPVPSEVLRYESWQRRRLSMKPGLTCLWQVSGRSEIADFDHWMKLDLQYIDTWSLSLDLRILARTVPAVVSGRGAA